MHLTQYTDYSLRVLIYLGINDCGGTIGGIATSYGISQNHLVKVVHNLGQLGYVHTRRGRSGGLNLAVPSDQLNVGEVVRKVEPHFNLVECFSADVDNNCPILPVCRLKGTLQEAQQAFLAVLDGYTLSDLLLDKEAIGALLDISPAKQSNSPPS